ncbi:hypothetical protein FA15DRAFT_710296 [Coprinopsis marcescibilis]|uniref:Conserved oligomeric Golgi complex subunit 3 C-terminal domain-containing protein n=1 Tax=Coprinopsis marcescibilis TaxID=230819 RepID=A0A5C3KD44_COPMA|nr:hypothetical protein FA15DRAFT_710296 [Coprinopsis marcescibilis]
MAQMHLLCTRFRFVSNKVAPQLVELERRARSYPDELVAECHASYFSSRKALLLLKILEEIKGLDHTRSELVELTRAGCGYPKQLCTDEFNLYLEFFGTLIPGHACDLLYDDLRPRILREPRLTAFCKVCTVLQTLMVLAAPISSTSASSTLFSVGDGMEVIASSVSTTRNPIDQWVTRLQPFSSSDSNPTAKITFNFQTPPLLSTALQTGVPTTSSAIDVAMLSTTTHVAALYAEFRVAIKRDLRANVARIRLYRWGADSELHAAMSPFSRTGEQYGVAPQYGLTAKILIDHIQEWTLESFQNFVDQVREALLGGAQDGEGRDLVQEIGSSQGWDSIAAADARETDYNNELRPRTFAHALVLSPTHPLSVARGEEDPKPKDIHDYSSSVDDDDSRTGTN